MWEMGVEEVGVWRGVDAMAREGVDGGVRQKVDAVARRGSGGGRSVECGK